MTSVARLNSSARDFLERRKNRGHGVVYPDIDRAELLLDGLCSGLDFFAVGYIGRDCERFAAGIFNIGPRAFQAVFSTRDQPNPRAAFCECLGCGAAHAGRCACDDDDFPFIAIV